jgi:hypothetical protein
MNSLTKSALLAHVSAKLHNQHPQFFLSHIWFVHLQHCDKIIFSSIFQDIAEILLEFPLAANGFLVDSILLWRLPLAWHIGTN